jgi:hypothetical protein
MEALMNKPSAANPAFRTAQRQISDRSPGPDTEQAEQSSRYLSKEAVQQARQTPRDLSRNDVLQLQRTLGNQSVRRILTRASTVEQPAVPRTTATISHPARIMRQSVWRTGNSSSTSIQRTLKKLPGKSSGWFRKGRRDKLNSLVEAYNSLEMATIGSKKTVAGYQNLLTSLNEIWKAAHDWKLATLKKTPEKAGEIQAWIDKQVLPEISLKENGIEEIKQAAALEDSWKGAKYNAAYAGPAYTTSPNAGLNWLAAPEIAGVYKYHIIKNQFDGATLNAYEDLMQYKQNKTAGEALRIYRKYQMNTSNQLNITGEGAGGLEGIGRARAAIEALEQNPQNPPDGFGAIETSIQNVLNEIMISFKDTEPYKKITTPPNVVS